MGLLSSSFKGAQSSSDPKLAKKAPDKPQTTMAKSNTAVSKNNTKGKKKKGPKRATPAKDGIPQENQPMDP